MSLYVNRLRYGYGAPTIGASSGIVNNGYYKGKPLYEDDWHEPEIDYNQEYFHVLSWEDNNTFTLQNDKRYTLYYSTDLTNWSSTSTGMTYTLSKGQRLYWKGNLSNSPLSNSNNDTPATTVKCSKTFEICGNLCSLFYGDNFIGKTDYNGCYWIRIIANNADALISIRNLILPNTNYSRAYNYRWFGAAAKNLLYGIKELPASTTSFGSWPVTSFYEGCSKIQETPVMRFSTTDLYQMIYNTAVKRMIWLGPSGYPSNMGTPATGSNYIKYKLSTNTASGTYRDFDTLETQGDFLSIWAETETPYAGMVAGCSDYFVAGDSVTLEYVAVNESFNGYYDENDNLLSNNSTYTFTAQRNMKIKVKTYYDYSKDYFTIESLEDGNTISLNTVGTAPNSINLFYSTDNGSSWKNDTTSWTINKNEKILLKCSRYRQEWSTNSSNYRAFTSTKTYKVYGNIMSMLNGDNFISGGTSVSGGGFNFMFYYSTHLVSAENLIMPATSVASAGYQSMFEGCSSLLYAPAILPGTSIETGCYENMFAYCTLLTTTPLLPVSYVPMRGYEKMFYECTSINKITCLAKSFGSSATSNWLYGVSASGTFYKNSAMSSWPSGASGIPSGWTVQDYVA